MSLDEGLQTKTELLQKNRNSRITLLDTSEHWPPVYRIQRRSSVRHVQFKVKNTHHLILILPSRFSEKHIPLLLENHKSWIQTHWRPLPPIELPRSISFNACNRILKIDYIATNGALRCIAKPGDEWVFYGDIKNHKKIFQKLKCIIKTEAEHFLREHLLKISLSMDLPFSNFSIREQSTRWGSCSIEKNISLNQQLMFLPYELVRYVIIHELCHTKELNHSKRFWHLVEKYDPNWQVHRKALRLAQSELPKWLSHE